MTPDEKKTPVDPSTTVTPKTTTEPTAPVEPTTPTTVPVNVYEAHKANLNIISVKAARDRVAEFGGASVADSWVLLKRPNGEVDPVDATQLQRYLDLGWIEPPVEDEEAAARRSVPRRDPTERRDPTSPAAKGEPSKSDPPPTPQPATVDQTGVPGEPSSSTTTESSTTGTSTTKTTK